MATALNFINRSLNGRLGNVIYYERGGQVFVRRRPVCRRKRPTESQQLWRERFRACVMFYNAMDERTLRAIWKKRGTDNRCGLNAFVASSIRAFDRGMSVGDFGELHCSTGDLWLPAGLSAREESAGRWTLCWDTACRGAHDRETDRLMAALVLAGDPFCPRLLENVTGTRADGRGEIRLPGGLTDDYHLYCFFASADGGNYSDDRHIRKNPDLCHI